VQTATESPTFVKTTKGSKTVEFYIQNSTSGLVADTGTIAANALFALPKSDRTAVSFTIPSLATGDKVFLIIGTTIYTVTHDTSATVNAAALVELINEGTQAYATSNAGAVSITLKNSAQGLPIYLQVFDTSSTGTEWTNIAPTVTTVSSIGEATTDMKVYKVATGVTTGAEFTLDYPATVSGYFPIGTAVATTAGIPNATINAYKIQLMGITGGEKHEVSLGGDLAGSTITYVNNPSYGKGTATNLNEIEDAYIHQSRGYFHPGAAFVEAPEKFVVANEVYDVVSITADINPKEAGLNPVQNTVNIVIALPVQDRNVTSTVDTVALATSSGAGNGGYLNEGAVVAGFSAITF
jgi:hypothetical protein